MATEAVMVDINDTHIETWFERDRAHVALISDLDNETLIEWWDDDVGSTVEDGYLNSRDWHGSAYEYAVQMGVIKEPDDAYYEDDDEDEGEETEAEAETVDADA